MRSGIFFAVLTVKQYNLRPLQKQLERRAKKFHYSSITVPMAIIVHRKPEKKFD